MIASTTIVNTKKVGRNDACPCGSNKKWKFCCGANVGIAPKPKKVLSPRGLQQCLMILIERAGGSVDISCEDLERLIKAKGTAMASRYDADTDSFHFEMIKIKVSSIIQPGGKKIEIVDEKKENEEDKKLN